MAPGPTAGAPVRSVVAGPMTPAGAGRGSRRDVVDCRSRRVVRLCGSRRVARLCGRGGRHKRRSCDTPYNFRPTPQRPPMTPGVCA